MSVDPRVPPVGEVAPPGPVPMERPRYRWYHKVSALVFVVFCLELGLFLLIFPWTDGWEGNFFSSLVPEWHRYWASSYVRGAISGLGIIDLYICFVEAVRLRRFAGK